MILRRLMEKIYPPATTPSVSTTESRAEARQALARASQHHAEAVRQDLVVTKIAWDLKRQLQEDRFGELLEQSMRRTRKP